MNLVLLLLTIIFGGLFLLRHHQFKNLKNYTDKIEKEFSELHSQQAEGSTELSRSNIEYFQKPSDPVTGLPARQAFDDRLQQAIYQSKRYQASFAVMSVDVNKFAEVNNLGYDIGDQVLKELAQRLQASIRQVDSITRYAGNNFIILLPQLTKPETAAYVAQRIQDNVMKPFHIGQHEILIGVAIGIAIYPVDGETTTILLQHLGKALEIAKARGINSYQFYRQEIHVLGERELNISSLVRAPNVCDRLQIRYTAGVSTQTNAVVRVEAIPYFDHPQFGEILYPDFVVIADNAGKNEEIGLCVLKSLLDQLKIWERSHFRITQAAIKVTLKQVQNPQFINGVRELLEKNSLNGVRILFEFAEANLNSPNSLQLDQSLLILHALGVQFVIGVYTLGHFALQKVTNIPISYLKIDFKLIKHSMTEDKQDELLHMMISLAKTSGIGVIVDGIENEKTKAELKGIECDIMQGKYFNNLLPAPEAKIS